jgi:CRP-like cAMP-binding protein
MVDNPEKIAEFLAKVPLFDGLTSSQLRKLANRCVLRRYQAGEYIITQGKAGEGLFILISGEAEVMRTRLDGSEVALSTFGPTDFFGEVALLHEGPRIASVITTKGAEALVLARWDFIATMREDADMGVALSQELAKRLRGALDALL